VFTCRSTGIAVELCECPNGMIFYVDNKIKRFYLERPFISCDEMNLGNLWSLRTDSNPDSLKQHFIRGVLGVGGLNLVQKLLSLLIAVLLARMLGTEGYGYYAFALSIIGVLAIPAKFGLPQLVVRETAAAEANRHWTLMRGLWRWAFQLILVTSAVICICIGGILLASADCIEALDTLTFSVALLMLPIMVVNDFLKSLLQGLRHVVQALWPDAMLKPILFLLILLILIAVGFIHRPEEAMALNLFLTIIVTMFLLKLLFNRWPIEARKSSLENNWRVWVRSLLPFTLLGGVNVIASRTDIIMLGLLTTPADVGIYHVVVRGGMLVSFPLLVFNIILAPNISRINAQRDLKRLQRLLTTSTAAVFVCAVFIFAIFVLAGDVLLTYGFGLEFSAGYWPLLIFGAGQLFSAGTGSVGLMLSMTGHERDTLWVALFSALANVILNFALIPLFGISGAATATATSILIRNVIMGVQVHRRLGLVPGPLSFKMVSKKHSRVD
jgi:O-antigen/teichoic acid export membrane protein